MRSQNEWEYCSYTYQMARNKTGKHFTLKLNLCVGCENSENHWTVLTGDVKLFYVYDRHTFNFTLSSSSIIYTILSNSLLWAWCAGGHLLGLRVLFTRISWFIWRESDSGSSLTRFTSLLYLQLGSDWSSWGTWICAGCLSAGQTCCSLQDVSYKIWNILAWYF